MNVPNDHMYNWSFSKDSKLIRFYMALYSEKTDPSQEKITFCKLFWGIIASPAVLVLAGIVYGAIGMGHFFRGAYRMLPEKTYVAPTAKELMAKEAQKEADVQRRRERKARMQARANAVSTWVAAFADKVSAFFQHLSFILRPAGWVIRRVGILIALLVPTAATSYLGYYVDTHLTGGWHVLEWAGAVAGIGVGAGLVVGTLTLLLSSGRGSKVLDVLETIVTAIFGPILRPIGRLLTMVGHGFVYVGKFLAAGYHVTKYRTCPKVVITD